MDSLFLISFTSSLLINISASPFHINKLQERIEIIGSKANDLKCSFIYCNLVGAQDELVFDGQSCIVNSAGDIIYLSAAFEGPPCHRSTNCAGADGTEFGNFVYAQIFIRECSIEFFLDPLELFSNWY